MFTNFCIRKRCNKIGVLLDKDNSEGGQVMWGTNVLQTATSGYCADKTDDAMTHSVAWQKLK